MQDKSVAAPPSALVVLTYVAVGFITLFLAAYVFTVSITSVPEWVIPDSLSPALFADIATRWQPWVFGLVGAWIGYKVGRLPVKPKG